MGWTCPPGFVVLRREWDGAFVLVPAAPPVAGAKQGKGRK